MRLAALAEMPTFGRVAVSIVNFQVTLGPLNRA
jgi:hypothetical protein